MSEYFDLFGLNNIRLSSDDSSENINLCDKIKNTFSFISTLLFQFGQCENFHIKLENDHFSWMVILKLSDGIRASDFKDYFKSQLYNSTNGIEFESYKIIKPFSKSRKLKISGSLLEKK